MSGSRWSRDLTTWLLCAALYAFVALFYAYKAGRTWVTLGLDDGVEVEVDET
jgi:hypothetical protein